MKTLLMTTAVGIAMASSALANSSTVSQINTGNIANVDQSFGSGSSSNVNQTGSDDVASVTQGDGGGVNTNTSDIQQLGGSGVQTATVTQNNAGNGLVNTALVGQVSTQGGNAVDVIQDGAGNFADAQQGPGAASITLPFVGTIPLPAADITNSSASLTQIGDGNSATTRQIVGSNGGDSNMIDVMQTGTINTALVEQGSGTGVLNPASNDNNNSATIIQDGVDHDSTIRQGGESGLAFNDQSGINNTSTIEQSGGGFLGIGNQAFVEQTGNSSTSVVDQTGGTDNELTPTGNLAEVTQSADNSMSTITQGALGGHTATVMQSGTLQASTITQSGLFNNADVVQADFNQTSTITQSGPGLITPLLNNAEVSQVASAGNNSTVTQMGIGNNSVVMQ